MSKRRCAAPSNALPYRFVAGFVFGLAIVGSCFGQLTYIDRHDFGATGDVYQPQAAVSFDASGNMFGVTAAGGTYGKGGVWEITASGTYKVLHSFGGTITYANGASGPDGSYPQSPVLVDGSEDLFGTTSQGGPNYSATGNGDQGGVLWEITETGLYMDLHDFGGTVITSGGSSGLDGQGAAGQLYMDGSGNLFGTTEYGGEYYHPGSNFGGIIWKLTDDGTYHDIHDFEGTIINAEGFSATDGGGPIGGIVGASTGNLYGVAGSLVWELTTSGAYIDLHDFGGTIIDAEGKSGPDGTGADSNVVFDSSGDMFGTTYGGGPYIESPAQGMIWEITAVGEYRDLHDFGGLVVNSDNKMGPDGGSPVGQVAIDSLGNLFGTTQQGGPNDGTNSIPAGNAWEVTSTGQYLDIHDFGGKVTNSSGTSGPDGVIAEGVTVDSSGKLYGVCSDQGPNGSSDGLLWEMRKQQMVSFSLSQSTIGGLGRTVGIVTLAGPAQVGGWIVNLHAGASGYVNLPSSVGVAEGASKVTFAITGTAQRSTTLNLGIFASDTVAHFESILTIQGDEVNGLSFSPSTIGGSGSTTATVTLSSAAPPGGWIVNLSAGASGYLNMPASVTVPAGATSTTFTITGANQRTGNANIGVIASDDNASVESILTVQGDALAGISLSPTTIGWSGTSTGTVTLVSAAPEGGWVVNLKAGAPGYLSMPGSVTVPAGATTATFSVTGASQRSESATIGVIANDTGNQVEADLTLTGDSLTGVSVSPTSVAPGSGSTGTVTLSGPAPVGGWVVKLFSGAPTDVGVPATVTVPAGATSATFSITTPTNAVPSKYGVFANDGTAQFETFLTIT